VSRLALCALIAASLVACGGALGGADDVELRPVGDAEALAADFRAFLDAGRTPADVVDWTVARAAGWQVIDPFDVTAHRISAGDHLVFVNRGREALFVIVGERPLAEAGASMIGSHIDTPGPKLAADALVGGGELVAHLYGSARGYHWTGIPLALVGRVARAGGEEIAVRLGISDEDPFSLYVDEQRDDHLIAIAATTEAGKGGTKQTVLDFLEQRYQIEPDDLKTAELFLVPAWHPREVGLDRSLIGAHGQDDRVNSYAAWRAIVDVAAAGTTPKRMAIAWLNDREEVGSTGPTGARSLFLELVYAWLLKAEGARADEPTMARAFAATTALSADTPAAINPNFPEPHVERLAPQLGKGPVMFPYAGHGGKDGSQIAHAELIREVIDLFEAAGVPLQTGELGKVEAGGGGTVSQYLGERGIDAVDLGIAAVSIHSPMELTSKQDIWWGYVAYKAWLTH